MRLALEKLILFSDEAALFLDQASLLINESLLVLDQRFLRRKEVRMGAIGLMVAISIPIAISIVRTVVAIAVVVDPRRFVFDIVPGIWIVPVVCDRRRRRPLQNHFGIEFVIIEHPAAFGIVPIRFFVKQLWCLSRAVVETQRSGTIALGVSIPIRQ